MANPQGLAMRRLAVAAASGAIAFLVAWAAGAPWSVSILIGWDVRRRSSFSPGSG